MKMYSSLNRYKLYPSWKILPITYSYITGWAPGSARLTLTGRMRKGGMNALKASQGTVRETFLAK